ncbi:MAG: hypothetical protein WCK26_03220 [Candidatus Saccharibacteria bacterium]
MAPKNKKIVMYIIIAVVLVAVATTATIFALNMMGKKDSSNQKVVPTKESADKLKTKAIEYLKNGDKTNAKKYLLDAKQQYTELKDTNNIVDVDAQIWMIDHPTST